MEKSNYYADQLKKIKPGSFNSYPAEIKLFQNIDGKNVSTNTMSLNDESATILAAWLYENFKIIDPHAWWKSLDILKRIKIVEQYQEQTQVNDNFIEGLTDESEKWLIDNYGDAIKNYNP